jgi:FixJ family two-component response regulator
MEGLDASAALIAIVDDDCAGRASIGSLLRSAGYCCIAYESAEAFLESGGMDAHCLLLDVRMPGMNGLDLQLILKEMSCEIPIVYLTASTDTALRERAFRQGANGFLGKPFVEEDLLNAIRIALSGSGSLDPETRKSAQL